MKTALGEQMYKGLLKREGLLPGSVRLDVFDVAAGQPWHLLDDDPINEDEWQLPEDSGLEQLLRNEK